MRLKNYIIPAISLWLIVYSCFSQGNKILSLNECIKIGLSQNKNLKISKAKLSGANAKSDEVDAAMLPTLRLTGGYTRLSPVVPFTVSIPMGPDTMQYTISPTVLNNYMLKMTLQQPIFTGFRLQSNSELMEYNAMASKEDLRKDESQLELDIKNSYWSYFNAKQIVISIKENIQQVQEHLKDIENFFNHGLAMDNDVLKVKVQLSNLQLMKIDAENAVNMTRMALNNVLGMPVQEQTEIIDTVGEDNQEMLPLNALIDSAYDNRAELKSMGYRVKAGETGIKMANAGWYPQINFMADYNYSRPNPRIMPTLDEFIGTWDIGINFSFDLWNWRTTSYQVEQAKAALDQTRYSAELLRDAVYLDVSQSYLALSKAKEKISYARLNKEQAQENYRVTHERFKSGLALNSDLVDAETSLLIAEINYTSSLVEFKLSLAKLEKATGH